MTHRLFPPGKPGAPSRSAPLDGLRGVAILLVVMAHSCQFAGFGKISALFWAGKLIVAVPGAFSGVPLFFVISGFLITSILLRLKEKCPTRSRYYRTFFVRRALRIMPLYFVFLVSAFFVARWLQGLVDADTGTPFPGYDWMEAAGAGLFLVNLPPFRSPRYFIMAWSVCVEMQFYALWSVMVYHAAASTLRRICGGVFFATLAARVVVGAFFTPDFYLWHVTPLQLDGLAAGAWIALTDRSLPGRRTRCAGNRWWLPVSGMAGGMVFAYTAVKFLCDDPAPNLDQWPDPVVSSVGMTLNTLFFAGLVRWVSAAGELGAAGYPSLRDAVCAGLSARVLTAFGHYSYFIYFFNLYPLFALSRHPQLLTWLPHETLRSLTVFALLSAMSLTLGKISWLLLEGPVENLKDRLVPRDTDAIAAPPGPVSPAAA